MKKLTILLFVFIPVLFVKCIKGIKENTPDNGCIIPDIVPIQPYSDPVWHPNGQLLGFNYTPLAGIGTSGTAPCQWYDYFGKPDSTGFYIMNKDRTGFKRTTNFTLLAPAWSPDGNWIAFSAFSIGPQIYKMRFSGTGFDTANIIQLTDKGANFYPSWTANSDTIYYGSNNDAPAGTNFYSFWKMASNGNGKTSISPTPIFGRQPFIGNNNLIYYIGYVASQPEIFSMNKDGSNQIQVTFNGKFGNRYTPKYWQGGLFYIDNGTLRVVRNSTDIKLIFLTAAFDISINGEIVYSKNEYRITRYDKQIGTLWIVNADGTNNRQLTFNNF